MVGYAFEFFRYYKVEFVMGGAGVSGQCSLSLQQQEIPDPTLHSVG